MIAFLRRCCDGSQYKIIQRIEDLFERFENAIGGVDLPKLIANINLIAQYLVNNGSAIPNLPAIQPANQAIQDTSAIGTTNDLPEDSKQDAAAFVEEKKTQSEQESSSFIDAFFSGKEQVIKDEIREFMLANYNITALDDQIEGRMYDYMVDAIWHLAIKKYLPKI